MATPIASSSFEHCVILGCRHRPEETPCNVPLPRRSPLGIYEGLRYRTTGEWPATFVCLRHGHTFACSPDNVHVEVEMRGLGQPVSPLWKIESRCAHEDCGRLHTFYTGRMPDWAAIVERIVKIQPHVACGDHGLLWSPGLMRGTEFAH